MKVKEREGRQTVGIEVLLLHFVGDTLGNLQLLRCVVEDGRSVFCLKGERDRKGDKTSERTSANILALLVHRRGIVGAIEELCIMPDQNMMSKAHRHHAHGSTCTNTHRQGRHTTRHWGRTRCAQLRHGSCSRCKPSCSLGCAPLPSLRYNPPRS